MNDNTEITVNSRLLGIKDVHVHVEDWGGDGRPIVLIHGWPLSGKSWQEQIQPLRRAGYRVITYDRRGFGESDKPSSGYDYDTLADDVAGLIEQLGLEDVTLVGFSMGGGEVARYVSKHGQDRLHSVVFAAAIPPFMMRLDDNPDGPLTQDMAKGMSDSLKADAPSFYEQFVTQFFSANADGNLLVTTEQLQAALAICAQADTNAALEAMTSFGTTDFREDLTKITVPTLVIHGDADGIVPFEGSGKRTHEAIAGSQLVLIPGAPHGFNVSHAKQFNEALIAFLGK